MIGVGIHDLYQALEPHLAPVIDREAHNFHRVLGVDVSDAAQEARLALVLALPSYDYNKSRGGIKAFARRTIRNALCGLLYAATAQMRAPHVVVMDADGSPRLVRMRVDSLDAMELFEPSDDDAISPETNAINAQMDERILLLRLRLLMSLSGRERAVFECQATPSEAFLVWMRNEGESEPTIDVIGRYLGLTKNEIDWSVHKVKRLFTIILEESEFNDLINGAIQDGRWPMVYMSSAFGDVDFIQAAIQQLKLDPKPSKARDVTVDGDVYRIVESYEWGAILQIKLDEERQATLLLEGRFNYRTGEVIGVAGHWKQVADYVPWYGELNKRLAPKKV